MSLGLSSRSEAERSAVPLWRRVQEDKWNWDSPHNNVSYAVNPIHTTRRLDIQVLYVQSILFDELAATLDILTHQCGEDLFGSGNVF